MGPIVLCDTNNELSIVDGQQRLTSFTLLFTYLLHEQNKIKKEGLTLRELTPYLYVTKAGETTFVLNVKSRNKVLKHLIEKPETIFDDFDELENNFEFDFDDTAKSKKTDESIQNLIERYEDITKLFPAELKEETVLPIFVEWLLEKVVIVEVKAYSLENAYTIFETMNDRGLTLNPTEILKAFLLHKIDDESKSDDANEFWKNRIFEIKSKIGSDTELDFFRAWLRGKYAESKRDTKQGAENEDFEIIGTQFHSWVKNNPEKVYLLNSDEYYYFIKSDFDFYSKLYMTLFNFKNHCIEDFENIYVSNFYPIADSLSYPLFISPISKIDQHEVIDNKIKLVGKFIDIFTIVRVLVGRAITQSTIRYSMYELIRSVRNLEEQSLKLKLNTEIEKLSKSNSPFTTLHKMDNWGFYHYLFARLIFTKNKKLEFNQLLRSKKQSSLILYKFFDFEEKPDDISETLWNLNTNSVAGHCLVKRYDIEKIHSKKGIERLYYLVEQDYLPEMIGFKSESLIEFITERDKKIRDQISLLIQF
jgi:uncharacterized protein with ParB-like and HNH nuclease domain